MKNIADKADMIVNGYAFTQEDDRIRVLNLNNPSKAVLFGIDGEVLETSKDNAQGIQLKLTNMDIQAQRILRAVKETADAPRKTVVSDGPRFFNPATIKQLSEYLTTL